MDFENLRSSFFDLRYKKSLLHTLLFRSFSLSSNYEKFHQEIEYLKSIFKRNNYPTSFIDTSIRKFLKNIYTEKEVPPFGWKIRDYVF